MIVFKQNWRIIALQAALTFIFFLLVRVVISSTALSSFAAAVVEAEFEQDSKIEIFYSAGTDFQPALSSISQSFPAGKRSIRNINLKNHAAKSLRIDFGDSAGQCRLYQFSLVSFFGDKVTYDAEAFYQTFTPANDIAAYSLEGDHLLITFDGDDPFLVSSEHLRVQNFFLLNIFPLLLAYLFWIFIASFRVQSFPPFRDLTHKKSSLGIHISSLDGVRGMAAIMVLIEHSGMVGGIGVLGVWLFFALSGFLLVTPFVHDPAKAYSYPYIQTFLLRRLKRIVPMYYTFILVTMFFTVKNPQIFRHLLFLQGDGHLWSIPQEMFFYLLLPFIMLLCSIQVPRRKLYCLVLLTALIWLANTSLTVDVIALYGYGRFLRPLVGIFLSGVFFSYLFHWLLPRISRDEKIKTIFSKWASLLGLFLLVVSVSLHFDEVKEFTRFSVENHFGIFGFLAAAFIFLVVSADNTLLGRIANFTLFRAVGVVGFSFYLLHPIVIGFSRSITQYYFNTQLSGVPLLLVGGVFTYLLSMLTYTYIERPFIRINK